MRMVRKPTQVFDSQAFLAIVGSGKTILEFEKNQTIFSQGDAADAVFYIQEGKVKISVVSPKGK
jgi:CRP-like cAMP-binding protein